MTVIYAAAGIALVFVIAGTAIAVRATLTVLREAREIPVSQGRSD